MKSDIKLTQGLIESADFAVFCDSADELQITHVFSQLLVFFSCRESQSERDVMVLTCCRMSRCLGNVLDLTTRCAAGASSRQCCDNAACCERPSHRRAVQPASPCIMLSTFVTHTLRGIRHVH